MDSDNISFHPAVRHFHIADYAVFSLTLIISVIIGLYYACSGGKQKTVQEYLLGDRNMAIFPVAMSLLASFLSAVGMIAVPAEVYMYGVGMFYMTIGTIMAIPLAAYFYMPMFYKLKLTSVYEYIEKRFDSGIRKIGSLLFITQMVIYISFVIYAPALALSQVVCSFIPLVTGINLWGSVFAIGVLGTVYTSVGGIKAVMWTDVFQITIMFLALLVSVFKGAADIGGFSYVFSKNVEGERLYWISTSFDPRIRYTLWNSSIGSMSNWLATYGTNQAQVQRYMTSPSLKSARKTLWWNLLGLILFQGLIILSGLIIYARYWGCDPMTADLITAPDQIFPLFIMETLDIIPGLPGLFVAGVFSGSLSTVSSALNSLAAITLEDFVKAFKRWKNISSERAALVSKIFAASYGILCLVLVAAISNLGSILQANHYNSRTFGGIVFGLFTLGMFIPWANKYGAYSGVIGGLMFSLWVSIGGQMTKQYTPKAPISTDQCIEMYGSETLIYNNITEQLITSTVMPLISNISVLTSTGNSEYIFPLYQLSFRWMNLLSCSSVIIIGSIVSWFTGPTKLKNLDIRLVSPAVQYLLKKYWKKHLRADQIYEDEDEDSPPDVLNSLLEMKEQSKTDVGEEQILSAKVPV